MRSFKLKLVVYFLLLALVPLGLAFWGVTAVIASGETQRVDARLESGLRAALTGYQAELLAAGRQAATVATDPQFKEALTHDDAAALARVLRTVPGARVLGPKAADPVSKRGAVQRVATVLSNGRLVGEVVIDVPLDESLLQQLRHD